MKTARFWGGLVMAMLSVAIAVTAQQVALRFHRAGNPGGYPVGWPAEERRMGADTSVPDGFDTNFTAAQYVAYRSARQAQFNAWRATNIVAEASGVTNDVRVLSDLAAAYDNWEALDASQRNRALKAQLGAMLRLLGREVAR